MGSKEMVCNSILFERFGMNKHLVTLIKSLQAKSARLNSPRGFPLRALSLCVIALATTSASISAIAAPRGSHGSGYGGGTSHSSVTINVGSYGHGGYYRGGRSYYRSGYGGYGGYGRGYGYRGYGWGGFYSGLSLGLVIPFLPYGYATTWYGGSPYYYADDVYYVSNPGRGYRVVAPPDSSLIIESYTSDEPEPTPVVAAPPAAASLATGSPTPIYVQQSAPLQKVAQAPAAAQTQLYAYPKNGQTATQSTFDRIECERWGSGQTGYMPGQSVENTPPQRRADYSRAVSACLEGRGYTVR